MPRLRELVQENPMPNLDEITAFILYTLHSNTTHTEKPGGFSSRSDIAESFLFDRRAGYCQHYALTATLLYRLYGVPARYATPATSFRRTASHRMRTDHGTRP